MGIYKHFTLDERFMLASLVKQGMELREMSDMMARSISSISRELERNSKLSGEYVARYANKCARLRRKRSKEKYRVIENDKRLQKILRKELDVLTSPEALSQEKHITVSCATIYNWINRTSIETRGQLPQKGRRRRKYGAKMGRKQGWNQQLPTIHDRPQEVQERKRLYDYEGDTMIGSQGRLLTYTDRKSRFEVAYVLPNGESNEVYEKTKLLRKKFPINSLTYDRGSEFALWKMIQTATDSMIYFADAYSSWQRGTNENSNGRIRRVYPKGFNFSTITQKDLDRVIWKMNHSKRKCLDWKTPCEVFKACCTSD